MFKIGHIPWNKDTHIQTNTGKTHFKKGQHPSSLTEFKKGNKINLGKKNTRSLLSRSSQLRGDS